VCPGWVRTDMGGQDAHRTIEEGADGIVKLATIGKNGPTGKFFRDGKEISW
ncbi:MAG TPA: short-chain dehydrogenase, partial [bacterium]